MGNQLYKEIEDDFLFFASALFCVSFEELQDHLIKNAEFFQDIYKKCQSTSYYQERTEIISQAILYIESFAGDKVSSSSFLSLLEQYTETPAIERAELLILTIPTICYFLEKEKMEVI